MIWSRVSILRQFLTKRSCYQIKCFSTQKTESKSVKEIKDFVLNQSKWDSNASDLKKPVLIYANENTQFYRKLFFINVGQFIFWMLFANQGITFILNKPKRSQQSQPTEQFSADASVVDKFKVLWEGNKTQLIFSAVM